MHYNLTTTTTPPPIRGVNIGGWLVLERYITPSVFALNKCHLQGDLCWYPTSIGVVPDDDNDNDDGIFSHLFQEDKKKKKKRDSKHPPYKLCSKDCTDHPVLVENVFGATDYALDEWSLSEIWRNYSDTKIAESFLNVHFDKFVTYQDLVTIQKAGMTHIRVPLPHWILKEHDSDSSDDFDYAYNNLSEPYIAADRWKYFKRLCGWARSLHLKVWPNIHTAPGSQNAFDNSGHQGSSKTCEGWMEPNETMVEYNHHHYPPNVKRSLLIIEHITQQMRKDHLTDVIDGFGLLNEPYINCNLTVYEQFLDDGLEIVRRNLQPDTGVFVSDLFWAPQFNDGQWWLDESKYHNTYLDSHYYNVFTDAERHMSPSEKLEHVCDAPPQKGLQVGDCCWEHPDKSNTTHPSQGVQRIVTEFSAAYDSMPGELLKIILQSFQEHGQAPVNNRTLSNDRAAFLNLYSKAQMISMERDGGKGWFFWSLKMESDYFEEWDFLRGLEHGWFPDFTGTVDYSTTSDVGDEDEASFKANNTMSSEQLFGSCDSLIDESYQLNVSKVIHVYPWGDEASYKYWDPHGLGWKFDHEQETKKNSNSTDNDDVIQNVTTMLKHTKVTDQSEAAVENKESNESGDGEPSVKPQAHVTRHVVVIFQVLAVLMLLLWGSFAVKKQMAKRSERRRYQYNPIKDASTMPDDTEDSGSENNGKGYGAV